jgi:hypothetical protein
MPDTSPTPPPRPGIVPWLVGLFALWQLAFAPLANVMEFVPQRPSAYDLGPPIESTQRWGQFTTVEPIQWTAELVGDVLAFWGEVTGQEQGWNMFTPGFPPYTVVAVAELRFPDGTTDRVGSRFEPPDLARPGPRAPLIRDREFNFEANIVMLAWECDEKALADRPDVWRKLPVKARENDDLLLRWLTWRARRYQAAHPDRPAPTEVVLLLRYVPIPLPAAPDALRGPAFERPFARWRPGGPLEPGEMPLEGYDPVARRYVRLKRWREP